jgi:transcriptional regulator with XRE-family HTH domain
MMLPEMLRRDRDRLGLTVGQGAVRCRMSPRLLRQIEAGEVMIPTYEIWAAFRDLYGWPTRYEGGGMSA